jgi:hypothetical protein
MLHQLSICHIRIVPLKSDMLINQRLFHSKKEKKRKRKSADVPYQLSITSTCDADCHIAAITWVPLLERSSIKISIAWRNGGILSFGFSLHVSCRHQINPKWIVL